MRVLVLTSSTGGGHNTRARAFAAWAQRERDLGLEVVIHQALEQTHGLYHFGVGLYNWIQRTAPRLHHIYFNFLEVAGACKSPAWMLGVERFRAVLREHRPDVVLSVHGSLNHGFFAVARDTLREPPPRCVTYCGELFGGYGFSRHWVNPRADLFIGAVAETVAAARRWRMPAERARVGGFLLDPAFYAARMGEAERRAVLREKFELEPDRFTLLLTTGAVGANNHVALLDALKASRLRPQVIALCRPQTVWQEVAMWATANPELPVRPVEFTDGMAELLQCVSAVVARPGTGTTSEAMLSGCPVIFNGLGGVMPQEMITVKFAAAHGFARVLRRAADLPALLEPLMGEPTRLAETREKMARACPPGSPRAVLEMAVGRPMLPARA
jgi:processive 1,2-diacylglycerol beta-glucosyltransferase